MKKFEIMVVDDNPTMRLGMSETLKRDGYEVYHFATAPEALAAFNASPVNIVITDLKMEPMNGIDFLQEIKKVKPETEVMMVSAFGDVQTAVQAMQLGATDFVTKPFSPDELRLRVRNIIDRIKKEETISRLEEQNQLMHSELTTGYEEIIGKSEEIQQIFQLIEQVAGEDSSILIEGESGTGKELVARAIHQQSTRNQQPFIKVNCGALNDSLLESELFGHEKGAFTGAIKQKRGRFELADGGTLFMDEIGDVSTAMQVKLLRVLQEGEFERVGGETTLKVDVRIISATHQNFQQLISEGKFRTDLYYRLNVIPIHIPPLRKRKSDIPMLAEHFLKRLAARRSQPPKRLSPEGMTLLQEYSWPGNIRELENVIERLHVVSRENEISPNLIALYLGNTAIPHTNYDHLPLDKAVESFEKNLIVHAMQAANGVKNKAAKMLGIGTSALYYKLEKYGLL